MDGSAVVDNNENICVHVSVYIYIGTHVAKMQTCIHMRTDTVTQTPMQSFIATFTDSYPNSTPTPCIHTVVRSIFTVYPLLHRVSILNSNVCASHTAALRRRLGNSSCISDVINILPERG